MSELHTMHPCVMDNFPVPDILEAWFRNRRVRTRASRVTERAELRPFQMMGEGGNQAVGTDVQRLYHLVVSSEDSLRRAVAFILS